MLPPPGIKEQLQRVGHLSLLLGYPLVQMRGQKPREVKQLSWEEVELGRAELAPGQAKVSSSRSHQIAVCFGSGGRGQPPEKKQIPSSQKGQAQGCGAWRNSWDRTLPPCGLRPGT